MIVCKLACVLAAMGLSTALSPVHVLPQTAVQPTAAQDAMDYRLSWYRYDANLPLDSTIAPRDVTPVSIRYTVSYASVHDQRVPAILALPKQPQPSYPVVILVHGSGGNKDTSYIAALSQALTHRGFATFAIDTQYHGDRKRPHRG